MRGFKAKACKRVAYQLQFQSLKATLGCVQTRDRHCCGCANEQIVCMLAGVYCPVAIGAGVVARTAWLEGYWCDRMRKSCC